MEPLAIILIFAAVSCLVCGGVASHLATEKGYNEGTWFLIGFFLWILGVIAAAGLPDKKLREIFRNNIPKNVPTVPPKPSAENTVSQPPDPDTWICGKCFRVNPSSDNECYHCQTKRKD